MAAVFMVRAVRSIGSASFTGNTSTESSQVRSRDKPFGCFLDKAILKLRKVRDHAGLRDATNGLGFRMIQLCSESGTPAVHTACMQNGSLTLAASSCAIFVGKAIARQASRESFKRLQC